MNEQAQYYKTEPQKTLAVELDKLNAEWFEITLRRKRWMDKHMKDFAKYKISETIYSFPDGVRLGEITRLYRYYEDRDPQYDYSMDIHYEFRTNGTCHDNTSRLPVNFCNAEELNEWRAKKQKGMFNHD
jgi:hypothetical protein